MTRIQRLFAQAFWSHFAIVLIAFAGLQVVFRFLDESKLISSDYRLYDTLYVAVSALPFRLYQDLPYVVLIAVSTSMGGLAQTSQITVLRNAGLSRVRLFCVLAVVIAPLYVASLVAAEFGVMQAEHISRSYKDARRGGSAESLWSRDGAFIVHASVDRSFQIQAWHELEVSNSQWRLVSHLSGEAIQFESSGSLQMKNATRHLFQIEEIGQTVLPVYARATELSPDTIAALTREPELLRLSELIALADFSDKYELSSAIFERTLIQRLTLPLTLIALAFLGFQTAFGSWRSGSMMQRVFIAIGFGIAYKYLAELASPVVVLLGLPIILGSVIPLLAVVGLGRLAVR
jgi:lipopolysaccharide export system permease protein